MTATRTLRRAEILLLIFLAFAASPAPGAPRHSDDADRDSLVQVDHRAVVSQADLTYLSPVERGNQGHPIGNGRMGSMVWTTPGAVHFQINRNDVFAVNRDHVGLQMEPPDYAGGCAQIQLDAGGEPFKEGDSFERICHSMTPNAH